MVQSFADVFLLFIAVPDVSGTNSNGTWTQQAKLTASDGESFDYFGVSVALSTNGNTAIIGQYDSGGNPGAVYVFTNSNGTWTQQAKLTASDGTAGNSLGERVALSSDGNTAIACAEDADIGSAENQGAAYVFTRSGSSWTQQGKLTAADGAEQDHFGNSVALSIDGNTAVIGVRGGEWSGIAQGAAYVFSRSGSSWTQQAKLTASDGATNDDFGASVALSGDGNTAIIGAENADVGGHTNQGAAYVFTNSSGTWTQHSKLTSSDGAAEDRFCRVAMSSDGNTVAVGAGNADVGGNANQGAVYVFQSAIQTTVTGYDLQNNGSIIVIDLAWLPDNKILVAGWFTNINGVARHGLCRLNADGSVDSSWGPTNINGSFSMIEGVASDGTNVYISGSFTSIDGVACTNFAKLDAATGAPDPTFTNGTAEGVSLMVFHNNALYIGGSFTNIGGASRTRLAKLNPSTGQLDSSFTNTADNSVYSIVPYQDSLYIGGTFSNIGGIARTSLAKLNTTNGAVDSAFTNGVNTRWGYIYTMNYFSNSLYVGGWFTNIGGISRNYIAKLNPTNGTPDGSYTNGGDSLISTLVASSDSIYAAGFFTNIGGIGRNLLAKLNPSDGSIDTAFTNQVIGRNDVKKLAFRTINGTNYLYVGGDFTNVSGVSAKGLALIRWQASSSTSSVPSAPTGVSATDGTYTDKVRVTWNASSGADGYQIWRNTSDTTNTASQLGTATSTTYDDTTATAGTTYYYWLKATNSAGASSFSSSDSGYRGTSVPVAPTGVSATDGTYTDKVRVTWNASSGATGYQIWRNTSDSTNAAGRIGGITNVLYDDTTATAGTIYYYWLKATNSVGASPFSSSDSGYRRVPTPGQVAFSASTYTVNENAGSVTLTVTRSLGSDDAASINFATQDGTAVGGVDYTAASGTLSWSDGDSASKTFTITIINRSGKQDNRDFTANLSNASGVSLVSPYSATVTIQDLWPPTASGVTASKGVYPDKVLVYWDYVPALFSASYKVWRGTDNNLQNASLLGTCTTAFYLDTSTTPDVPYYYWIQAFNTAGTSDLSVPDSGYCGSIAVPANPAGISASDGTYTDRISISWQTASRATQYELWRATENNLSAATLINETTGTSYSDTSAAQGICYYYWVRAKNANGYSDYGTQDSGWRLLSSPAGVNASKGTYPYHIRVVWNAVANADWYEVWREEVPGENSEGGNLTNVAQTNGVYFNDYQTKSGVYYRYKVKAGNGLGSSLDYGYDTGFRQVAAASTLLPVLNDYDGDKLSDLALFNSSSGVLDVLCSALGQRTFDLTAQVRPPISCSRGDDAVAAGGIHPPRRAATRIEIPIYEQSQGATGDIDGDQLADPLAYNSGAWLARKSSVDYTLVTLGKLGGNGDNAVTADYDGDRLADIGAYNEINGVLAVILSNNGAFDNSGSCRIGGPGYCVVSADFDGDGLADPAVYSETCGRLFAMFSGNGYSSANVIFGGPGKSMYSADFDGDGLADPVLYEPFDSAQGRQAIPSAGSPRPELGTKAGQAGTWTALLSSAGYSAARISFGGPDYVPAIGDYDGDGLADPAIYRKSDGQWLIMFSASGYSIITETFGGANFCPFRDAK